MHRSTRSWPLVCLGFLAPFAAGGASAADAPLAPAGRVVLDGIEGRLDHLTVDTATHRLFVAALEQHAVEVIDLDARRVVHEIPHLAEPQGLCYVSGAKQLLVCCRGDGTCRSFDGSTFTEGPWVDLGRNADNIRLASASGRVLVGSGGEPGLGLMSAIRIDALLPVEKDGKAAPPRSPADILLDRPRQADPDVEVPLAAHPESFQLDEHAGRIYVNVPDAHEIDVLEIGATSLSVVAKWPVRDAEKNFPMALDTADARLFVACRKPPLLLTFDTRTGQVTGQAPCVGDADDLFYDATERRVYVVGGEGFVDVFDARGAGAVMSRLGRVATAARARTSLFLKDLKLLAVVSPRVGDAPAAVQLFRVQH